MFFLVIDSHSKWGEVREMSSTTTLKTIEVLRELFSSVGLPEQLVSDNGAIYFGRICEVYPKQQNSSYTLFSVSSIIKQFSRKVCTLI